MKVWALIRRWIRLVRLALYSLLTLPSRLDLVGLAIRAFAFPQHDWAKRLRRNLANDAEAITWQQAINPLYWTVWGSRFFWRWLVTRPYISLAPAIPALLVLSVLAATAIAIARRDSNRTQTVYLDRLRTSLASGETKVAAVAAQRLLELDPDNLEHQYQLAMLDNELGHTESARRAIFRLAIQKQYGPAALWMLKALVFEEPKEADDSWDVKRRTQWDQSEQQLCHQCAHDCDQ